MDDADEAEKKDMSASERTLRSIRRALDGPSEPMELSSRAAAAADELEQLLESRTPAQQVREFLHGNYFMFCNTFGQAEAPSVVYHDVVSQNSPIPCHADFVDLSRNTADARWNLVRLGDPYDDLGEIELKLKALRQELRQIMIEITEAGDRFPALGGFFGVIVIGRKASVTPSRARAVRSFAKEYGFEIMTYDRLIDQARSWQTGWEDVPVREGARLWAEDERPELPTEEAGLDGNALFFQRSMAFEGNHSPPEQEFSERFVHADFDSIGYEVIVNEVAVDGSTIRVKLWDRVSVPRDGRFEIVHVEFRNVVSSKRELLHLRGEFPWSIEWPEWNRRRCETVVDLEQGSEAPAGGDAFVLRGYITVPELCELEWEISADACAVMRTGEFVERPFPRPRSFMPKDVRQLLLELGELSYDEDDMGRPDWRKTCGDLLSAMAEVDPDARWIFYQDQAAIGAIVMAGCRLEISWMGRLPGVGSGDVRCLYTVVPNHAWLTRMTDDEERRPTVCEVRMARWIAANPDPVAIEEKRKEVAADLFAYENFPQRAHEIMQANAFVFARWEHLLEPAFDGNGELDPEEPATTWYRKLFDYY